MTNPTKAELDAIDAEMRAGRAEAVLKQELAKSAARKHPQIFRDNEGPVEIAPADMIEIDMERQAEWDREIEALGAEVDRQARLIGKLLMATLSGWFLAALLGAGLWWRW